MDVQGVELRHLAQRRVRGVEQLETAVEDESVNRAGALAAAHGVLALQNNDLAAAVRQGLRSGEPGQARADDNDVCVRHVGCSFRVAVLSSHTLLVLCARWYRVAHLAVDR